MTCISCDSFFVSYRSPPSPYSHTHFQSNSSHDEPCSRRIQSQVAETFMQFTFFTSHRLCQMESHGSGRKPHWLRDVLPQSHIYLWSRQPDGGFHIKGGRPRHRHVRTHARRGHELLRETNEQNRECVYLPIYQAEPEDWYGRPPKKVIALCNVTQHHYGDAGQYIVKPAHALRLKSPFLGKVPHYLKKEAWESVSDLFNEDSLVVEHSAIH